MSQRKQRTSSKNVKPGTVQQCQQTNKPQRKHQFMRNQWQMGNSHWHQCCQIFCHPLQTFTKVYKACSIWMVHLWAQMKKTKQRSLEICWSFAQYIELEWSERVSSQPLSLWWCDSSESFGVDCNNLDNVHRLKCSRQTSGHPKVSNQNCLLDVTVWTPLTAEWSPSP